jgi:hypothetical protein
MATIASGLLQRHIETLVHGAAEWETLIADDIVWELAYAPSVGHPGSAARLLRIMAGVLRLHPTMALEPPS